MFSDKSNKKYTPILLYYTRHYFMQLKKKSRQLDVYTKRRYEKAIEKVKSSDFLISKSSNHNVEQHHRQIENH